MFAGLDHTAAYCGCLSPFGLVLYRISRPGAINLEQQAQGRTLGHSVIGAVGPVFGPRKRFLCLQKVFFDEIVNLSRSGLRDFRSLYFVLGSRRYQRHITPPPYKFEIIQGP